MEVSPVQANAKTSSSDFSIRRILSVEPSSGRDLQEPPSWVCCTRYRPPRLPRSSSGGRARRSGRHARVPFTAAQAAALEAAYARAHYLAPPALRALAAALQLRDDRIKIWFQNRRARERREKSGSVPPPHAVALPATSASAVASFMALEYVPTPSEPDRTTTRTHNYKRLYARHDNEISDDDEERCHTPLDVETVDE